MFFKVNIEVEGERFQVSVEYGEDGFVSELEPVGTSSKKAVASGGPVKTISAPLEGKFYLTKESAEVGS